MCTLQYLCLCTYLVCVCNEPINQTVCVWPGFHLSSPCPSKKTPLRTPLLHPCPLLSAVLWGARPPCPASSAGFSQPLFLQGWG